MMRQIAKLSLAIYLKMRKAVNLRKMIMKDLISFDFIVV
jgi:hypothetical protein